MSLPGTKNMVFPIRIYRSSEGYRGTGVSAAVVWSLSLVAPPLRQGPGNPAAVVQRGAETKRRGKGRSANKKAPANCSFTEASLLKAVEMAGVEPASEMRIR